MRASAGRARISRSQRRRELQKYQARDARNTDRQAARRGARTCSGIEAGAARAEEGGHGGRLKSRDDDDLASSNAAAKHLPFYTYLPEDISLFARARRAQLRFILYRRRRAGRANEELCRCIWRCCAPSRRPRAAAASRLAVCCHDIVRISVNVCRRHATLFWRELVSAVWPPSQNNGHIVCMQRSGRQHIFYLLFCCFVALCNIRGGDKPRSFVKYIEKRKERKLKKWRMA